MKLDFDIVTSGEEVDFDLASGGQQVDFELSNVQVVNVGGGGSGDIGSEYQKKWDKDLKTYSNYIVGAINEVHDEVDELAKEIPSEADIKDIVDDKIPDWVGPTKPTYTANEVGAVPTTRTINNKQLSTNITLNANDVGALPSNTNLFSGKYSDLEGKPTIPTKTSQLTNDSNFITKPLDYHEIANTPVLSTVATSGSYSDLIGKPTLVEDIYATINGNSLSIKLRDGAYKTLSTTSVTLPTTSGGGGGGGETPDLSGYIKFDNVSENGLSTANNTISLKTNESYGTKIDNASKNIAVVKATTADIEAKSSNYKPIVPANLEDAMRVGVSNNTQVLSPNEKASAIKWLGISGDEGLDSGLGTDTIIDAINVLVSRVEKLEGFHSKVGYVYIGFTEYSKDNAQPLTSEQVKDTNYFTKYPLEDRSATNNPVLVSTTYQLSNIYLCIPKDKTFTSIVINAQGESLDYDVKKQEYTISIDGIDYSVYLNAKINAGTTKFNYTIQQGE